MRKSITAFVCIVILATSITYGFETDQYNLPPQPLADVGDEVSEHSLAALRDVVAKINEEIELRRGCLEKKQSNATLCKTPDEDGKRLEYLLTNSAVAYALYKSLGDGSFPFTKIGKWMNTHEFRSQPARFKTSYPKSIFVLLPTNYLTISPTINMYGSQFGVDKIEHFFQQGYTYYKMYEEAVSTGSSPEIAVRKAVRWGKVSERTFFGSLVSGVFSNADLYANYAGMKFYQRLFRSVEVGSITLDAVLKTRDGKWVINDSPEFASTFIRPYITDHLNEALNPSIFSFNLRPSIRRIVKKRACPQWIRTFPNLTKADSEATTASLRLWKGEDYGFTASRKFITIGNTCVLAASANP